MVAAVGAVALPPGAYERMRALGAAPGQFNAAETIPLSVHRCGAQSGLS